MPGIRADWKAISLCLLAASTFWFFNAMNDDHTADISYPIEFIYNEEKYIPVESLPEKVRINASGYGWDLLRKTLKLNRTPVTVDLEELNSTKYVTAGELLPVLKAQLDQIRVNYVLQDTLYLEFERLMTKEFTVRADTSDLRLAENNRITSKISVTPKTVEVTGPASYIKSLSKDSFYVKIREKSIDSDYNENIELDLNLHPLANLEPEEVNVSFSVEKFEKETIEVEPTLKNFPKDSSLVPATEKIEVTFIIKKEDIPRLRENLPQVALDLRKLQPDSTVSPQIVKKPEYIKEYYFTPSSIRVVKKD